MLLAFMGAAMGWAYSWRAFVDAALLAYMSGVSAQQLMYQVSRQEFSQAGTMFKAAASASIQSEKINAEAFARFVSSLSILFRTIKARGQDCTPLFCTVFKPLLHNANTVQLGCIMPLSFSSQLGDYVRCTIASLL